MCINQTFFLESHSCVKSGKKFSVMESEQIYQALQSRVWWLRALILLLISLMLVSKTIYVIWRNQFSVFFYQIKVLSCFCGSDVVWPLSCNHFVASEAVFRSAQVYERGQVGQSSWFNMVRHKGPQSHHSWV